MEELTVKEDKEDDIEHLDLDKVKNREHLDLDKVKKKAHLDLKRVKRGKQHDDDKLNFKKVKNGEQLDPNQVKQEQLDLEQVKDEPVSEEGEEFAALVPQVLIKQENRDTESEESDRETYRKKSGQCKLCGKHVKDMKGHKVRVHDRKRFKCHICDRGYHIPSMLRRHIDELHGSPEQQETTHCDICDTMVTMKLMSQHVERLHSNSSTYSCLFCVFKSRIRAEVVKHTLQTHENTLTVSCPVCNKEVLNLEKHIIRHSLEKYKCTQCDFRCPTRLGVDAHFRDDHLADKFGKMPKNFVESIRPRTKQKNKCVHCDYETDSMHNLKKHISTVHEGVTKTCDICGGEFKCLNTHKRNVHEKRRGYPCEFCEYKAVNNAQLRNHIKVKHLPLVDRSRCGICGKTVKFLDKHFDLVHSADPEVKAPKHFCDYCEYKSHDKSAFSAHVKTKHTKPKTKCKVCGKEMITTRLSGHMKSHRDNQFSCLPCVRSFRERRDLSRHILYQHRNYRHTCQFCDKQDVTDLLAHIKYQHKEVDWQAIHLPEQDSDRIIVSLLVRMLGSKLEYTGDDDPIENLLHPVLQLLQEKGRLEASDIDILGYNTPTPPDNTIEDIKTGPTTNGNGEGDDDEETDHALLHCKQELIEIDEEMQL